MIWNLKETNYQTGRGEYVIVLEFPILWTKNKKMNPYGPRPDKAQQNTPFKTGNDILPFKSFNFNQEDT